MGNLRGITSVNCSVLFLTKVKKLWWFHRSSLLLAGVKFTQARRALEVLAMRRRAPPILKFQGFRGEGSFATCCRPCGRRRSVPGGPPRRVRGFNANKQPRGGGTTTDVGRLIIRVMFNRNGANSRRRRGQKQVSAREFSSSSAD